jgi:hypothetical protein
MNTFLTVPNTARVIKATEARLERIYAAAKLGLKGDSLALHAGLRPDEYHTICEFDPLAKLAEQQGRADSEAAHSQKLAEASLAGDAKASLAILQHQHGWSSKDAAVAGFGEGGIVINISGVNSPYVKADNNTLTIDNGSS